MTGKEAMKRLPYWLDLLNLNWFIPLVEMARGEDKGYQLRRLLRMIGLPVVAVCLFLLAWHAVATSVRVGSMRIPTPAVVGSRAVELVGEWTAERARRAAYQVEFAEEFAKAKADDQTVSEAEFRQFMVFEPKRTFVDQVLTSLLTVFTGFAIAMVVAVPLGILCGSSRAVYEMVNPLVQVFKPVSPLAWFPVVFIVVNSGAAAAPIEGTAQSFGDSLSGVVFWFSHQPRSFRIAAIVVALCSIWPTLINTANGVANVERDHLNVAKVLNLGWFKKVWLIVLPATLPSIFTGMRLSLGIAWMVLIAAEMMSVNPGMGMFIWNWYQSSNEIALGYLITAVLCIGVIGFTLDRMMISLQKIASRGNIAAIR